MKSNKCQVYLASYDETIIARLSGKLLNRSIPIDDIQPFTPHSSYPLYVAETVVKQNEPNSVRLGAILLGHTGDLLVEYAQEGINFHEIYAVATSKFGIRVCRSLRMEPLDLPEGTREDRIPFRLDIQKSGSLLVSDYRKSVA